MIKPILFSYPGACSRVTMPALEEAEVQYENCWINLGAKAQFDETYLKLNRKGKVPALAIDGKILTENVAILHYLHTQYPQAKLLPHSTDSYSAAQGLSDLVWCSSMLHPTVRQIRAPQKWTKGETDGIVADGKEKLAVEAKFINDRLSQSEWWHGDTWSIVDTYIYWALSTAAKSGDFLLSDYPYIAAHANRVRSRPSFRRVIDKEVAAVKAEGFSIDPAVL